jgi:hypothetical protein
MLEEEFANEFTVTASSAGAGSYAPSDDLIQTSQDILDNYDSYQFKRLSNIGLIFKSMDSVYSLNMMDRIFQPDYVADSGFIVVFLFIYYLLLKLLIF